MGWSLVDNNLTFTPAASGNTYTITQIDPNTRLSRNITFPTGINDVTVMIDDINITGNMTLRDGNDATMIINDIYMYGVITLQGDAELDLLLNGTNNVTLGIRAPEGTTLTIDSVDSTPTDPGSTNGSLKIPYSSVFPAGIGGDSNENGGNITINGGTVDVKGDNQGAGIGGGYNGNAGNIIINGGMVNATGQYNGSGIGGGQNGNGGNITINGGTVNSSSWSGAGIGGGYNENGGNITINSGIVTASGPTGIGGGMNGPGGNITIIGGTVNASGTVGAGIGSGNNSTGGNITISGGTVNASGISGAGIGSGANNSGGNITISGGTVTAFSGGMYYSSTGPGIGGGNNSTPLPTLDISSTADVKAYSYAHPAINVSGDNLGDGFYVNAQLNKTPSTTTDTKLKIYAPADPTTPLNELLLPANFVSFAYTTGSTVTQTDHIAAYNASNDDYLGHVV